MPKYSVIIPVYNRPDEMKEMLDSLVEQTSKNFEVVVVEDGSTNKSEFLIEKYDLDIIYFFKENSGPGDSRNFGMAKAQGDYLLFFDSDCALPLDYFEKLEHCINEHAPDAFGGPDAAHESFSNIQKAINYAMTSFLTTGGIRGSKTSLEKFHPRSFNMGYSRNIYEITGGFSQMRFGEDIDMSIRINKAGFKTMFLPLPVFHKRRSSLRQFFKQVFNSGVARINLYLKYPDSLKMAHLLPSAFTLGTFGCLIMGAVISPWYTSPLVLFSGLVISEATFKERSLLLGLLSVVTSFLQLVGYGTGFLYAWWKRIVLRKNEFSSFNKTFYK